MRKLLLGTTAVVGAALFAPAALAQAQPAPSLQGANALTVRLGGFFDFTYGVINDDFDAGRYRAAGARRRQNNDFRNDLELHVFIDGRAATGLSYGAAFEFQMDNNSIGTTHIVDMDEAWVYVRFPGLGEVRFGQEDSAASLLQVRPPASYALGADGDWLRFTAGAPFSSAYLISGINDGNDATKVIYLSPSFAGFEFGVSYAANSGEGRRTDTQRDRTGLENEWSVAVRYRGTVGPVGIALGAGAMGADAPRLAAAGTPLPLRAQNVRAYTVGATLSGMGFTLGGEYTWGQYNGSSVGRGALARGLDDSSHYLIGATYTWGPAVFGAIFGEATQDNGTTPGGVPHPDRRHRVWGLGTAYTLAPGLQLFAYYINVSDKNVPPAAGPSSSLFGGGTTLVDFDLGPAVKRTRNIHVATAGIRLAF